MSLYLGVDIGGTFTDVVLHDRATGRLMSAKVPTDYADPTRGILAGKALLVAAGQPVEAIYPTEGTPFVIGPNGIFKAAPNPNAAKLFQNYCFTPEAQRAAGPSGAPSSSITAASES